MPTLSVNIDHIATIREARRGNQPDPVTAAAMAELAGASGITLHLREDRRHIRDRDLNLLKQTCKTKINLEMAATQEMISTALDVKPHMVTLVPEKREELTTEGGLNIAEKSKEIAAAAASLINKDILVSLFIDPDLKQVKAAARCNVNYVELHTGNFANSTGHTKAEELDKIQNAAIAANKLGLGVNAGHGLDYFNVSFIAKLLHIDELSIGHAIIARAALVGMDRAVRDMVRLVL
ncbi:MAG: pyridoxine 5'-phosphate synthase [bacterium]